MFLVFIPVPYVDASDSYGFTNKWQRATVAAAGVMAELVIGALGVYIWVLVEPGILRAIAYNLVIIAGVSTLFVNGNPLMRFDGYFVLSECLEIPNLAQRATTYWSFLFDKYLFKSKEARSPSQSPSEAKILAVYGAIAPVYRLMISLSLAWFVASEYFVFGVIIALMGIWSSLALPFWKGWKHLSTSPTLFGLHKPAIHTSALALGVIMFVIVCVPVPFYAVSEAVVWVPEAAIVRAGESGTVETPLLGANVVVVAGDFIGQLENPILMSKFSVTEAQVDELDSQLRKQEFQEVEKSIAARKELEAKKEQLAEAKQKIADLKLMAHTNGRWMFANGAEPVGQYFKRGQIVGYVIAGPSKILRAAVPQSDVDLVRTRTKSITAKLVRQPFNTYVAANMRPIGAGQKQLVSAALGSEGGGLTPVDPTKNDPTLTLERVFDCEIELQTADSTAVFGDRAQVKFNLGWTPLANQFYIRLRQAFLTKLSV
jgi:putative peptide zinc metalloprotease protein